MNLIGKYIYGINQLNERRMKQIKIYTDGSCIKNPGGIGAYAYTVFYDNNYLNSPIVTKTFKSTTSNRMEIMAAIEAIKTVTDPEAFITLYSDSQYLVKSMEDGWLDGWISRNTLIGRPNDDLWFEMIRAVEGKKIKFKWVRGHNGNFHNERCDKAANEACFDNKVYDDYGYLKMLYYEQVLLTHEHIPLPPLVPEDGVFGLVTENNW